MKILVTGSTGLVGTALVPALARDGHTVCRLLRPQSTVKNGAAREDSQAGFAVQWNPATGELGGAAVGADAVVNLAGASIAGGRWTTTRKALLGSSRIDTTRALVGALAKMNTRPRVLVSASAIGVYGNRGDEVLTEDSKPGSDFLSALACQWEAEALKAETLGIRVVLARLGIILAGHGGALAKMLLPFRLGAGGRLGSGQQWMSWVTLDDLVGSLRFVLESASTGTAVNLRALGGAVNIVAPRPVRNREFTKVLAKALHRPALFPAPSFALRLALGEMADALLLSSQRVAPRVLEKSGYSFLHPDLASGLAAVL
ncbi:MAG TPA: TIGR01777 family oxidoreductase [Candidatus Udaeobacter sp.]|jgi:uncharacterized protein|nr:TIGR01777 family oxidoreductase [Candidatus Udaeobacter sp.]